MVKTVYFVRHGQTEWNLQKRLQGHLDSPLSPLGQEQAHQVGQVFPWDGVRQAWVSPLGRARQTAEIMAQDRPVEIHLFDELREVSFGELEGNTLDEIELQFPGHWAERQANKWSYRPPGGESNADALPRAQEMVRRIEAFPESEPLLIVAHFAINRLMLCELLQQPPEVCMRMNVPHGMIYRATQENSEWRLHHMDALKQENEFQPGWIEQVRPENQPIK